MPDLEGNNTLSIARLMPMIPTPANKSLALKYTGYSNLVDALEYAAQGDTGFNFYDGRGRLSAVLPYSELRDEAMVLLM